MKRWIRTVIFGKRILGGAFVIGLVLIGGLGAYRTYVSHCSPFGAEVAANMEAYVDMGLPTPIEEQVGEAAGWQRIVVLVLAALYMFFRAFMFHPLHDPAYRNWLYLRPHDSERAFIAGPAYLVWQDAIVVGLLCAGMGLIGSEPDEFMISPLLIGCVAYALIAALLLMLTGTFAPMIICFFVMSLHIWAVELLIRFNEAVALGWVCALDIGLALYFSNAIRRSLRQFPWNIFDTAQSTQGRIDPQSQLKRIQLLRGFLRLSDQEGQLGVDRSVLASSHFQLCPLEQKPCYSGGRVVVSVLLMGWMCFSVMWLMRGLLVDTGVPSEIPGMAGLFAALVRVCVYRSGMRPPISLAGRLATGRWVIPGYDRMYVAPLLAAMAAWLLPGILASAGAPVYVGLPATTMLATWCLIGMGPSLYEWRLTATARVAEPLNIRVIRAINARG
jgi:hypothetical protein